MAQTSQLDAATDLGSAIKGLLASLRGGLALGSGDNDALAASTEGDLFSDLLAATKQAYVPATPSKDEGTNAVDAAKTASNAEPSTIESVVDNISDITDDQRAALRELLNKIKEDRQGTQDREKTAATQPEKIVTEALTDESGDQPTEIVVEADKESAVAETPAAIMSVDEAGDNIAPDQEASTPVQVRTEAVVAVTVRTQKTKAEDTETEDSQTTDLPTELTDDESALLLLLQQMALVRSSGDTNLKAVKTEKSSGKSAETDTSGLAGKTAQLPAGNSAQEIAAQLASSAGTGSTTTATATAGTDVDISGTTATSQQLTAPPANSEAAASTRRDFLDLIESLSGGNKNLEAARGVTPASGTSAPAPVAPSGISAPVSAAVTAAQTFDMGARTDGGTTQGQQGSAQSSTSVSPSSAAAEGTGKAGSYNFAGQLSAAKATQTGQSRLQSVVEQVALYINKQAKAGNDSFTLQLRPAELGRVDIKLEISSDKQVQGTVTADNQSTLDLLSKDSDSLQRALQNAGLQADANCLQFTLRDGGQSGQANGDDTSNDNDLAESASAGTATSEEETDTETYYITPGRVNFKV